jgi:ParB-like chromosome segregation protein Spo0J
MITQIEYEPHPLAKMFPPMSAQELGELADDIKKNGQLDCIILYEDKILDGVHRAKACAMKGKTPRYYRWDQLPPVVQERGPLAFVIGRNLKRRHLTTSQRAMIATELIPAFEKEAHARKLAGKTLAQKCAKGDNGEVVRGKSTEQAAAAMGVSTRSVEHAKHIKAKSPKKAEKIKAGKLTVGKATRDEAKIQAAKQRREAAIARIRKVCGEALADAVEKGARLKKPKDVLAFVAQSDADMKRQAGLIIDGWPLKKAQLFRAKSLSRKHRIDDLLNAAASAGGAKGFSVEIDGWSISIQRVKNALK